MEQVVYVDLFFLINMSMDMLCFFLVCRLLSQKLYVGRCLLASALGGLYACAALLLLPSGPIGVIMDFAACAVMCAVAVYKRGRFGSVAAFALVYTAVSVLLGGFMTALFALFNRLGLHKILGAVESEEGGEVWMFALLAAAAGIISLFGGKLLRRRGERKHCRLQISLGGRTLELNGICDSGNLLREPISGKPCVVADAEGLGYILPRGFGRVGDFNEVDLNMLKGIRVIPCSTAAGGGMLYGFYPDGLAIDFGGGYVEADAYIALGQVSGAHGALALVPACLASGAP